MSRTFRLNSKDAAMLLARDMKASGLRPEVYRHAVELARMRHRAAIGRPGMVVKEHVTGAERDAFVRDWMLAGGEV